jgi:phage-related protein
MGVDFGTGYIDVQPRVDKTQAQSSMQRDLGGTLKSAGAKMTLAGAGLTAGLTLPIVSFGKSAVAAFQESAAVAAQTDAVIKSTGGSAGVTAKEVENLSTKLSEMSGTDDEVISTAQNMLLTFTNVKDVAGPMGDVFSDTTRLALDMSTALGTDAKSSAMMLGKALNDPTAGLTRLTRSGVVFTEQQKKQVEQLQKSGDTLGAQRVILDEVAKEFGGSAKAFGMSEAGVGAKNAVKMGNAMEDLGGTINEVLAPVMTFIADKFSVLANWFTNLPGPIKGVILGLVGLAAAAGPVLIVAGSLAVAIGAITAPIAIAIGVIAALIAIGVLLAANWETVMQALRPVFDFLKGLFIPVWEALKAVWTESILPALKDLWSAVKALWPVLKILLVVALAPIVAAFFLLMKALPVVIKVLGVLIRIVAAVIRVVAELVGWIADRVVGAFTSAWNIAQSVFGKLRDGFKAVADFASGVWDGVKAAFESVVDGIKAAWNATVGGFGFSVPSWVPGIGGKEFRIPELAEGGIVRRPTVALIGEAGPEAVVPLDRVSRVGSGAGGGQFIRGRLTLTPESEVLLRAFAADEDVVGERRDRTRARMNPTGRRLPA